jgi:hypothetical protein
MMVRRMLKAARLGAFAREALDSASDARLLGVFDRSIHLAVGDTVVCVVENKLGNGPLNAVLAPMDIEPEIAGWTRLAGLPGEHGLIDGSKLTVGRLAFDFLNAAGWQPPPWPAIPQPRALRSRLERLWQIANSSSPADGLLRLVLWSPDGSRRQPTIAQVAMPRILALSAWVTEQLAECMTTKPRPPPTTLLGLGPGLTPSGDDVLCGTMIALRAIGRPHAAEALAKAALREADAATTALSRAFLEAGAGGQGAEALHVLLVAVLSGQTDQLDTLVGDVARIGHTSGWDALVGAIIVLRAFADAAASKVA